MSETLEFPPSPQVDDIFEGWIWDGTRWNSAPGVIDFPGIENAPFLPIAGGTLTGDLTLDDDASEDLHAVPLQQLNSAIDAVDVSEQLALYLPIAGGVITGVLGVGTPGGPTVDAVGSVNVSNGFFVNGVSIGTGPFLPLAGGAISSGQTITLGRAAGSDLEAVTLKQMTDAIALITGEIEIPDISGLVTTQQLTTALEDYLPLIGGTLSGPGNLIAATLTLGTPLGVASGGTAATSFTANSLVATNTTATGALRVHSDLTTAQRGAIVDSLLNVSTVGFVRRSAANTYVIDSATYLTGNETITLSGDIGGSGTTSITTTLPNVNSNVGTFQGITVNAKGQVTSASNQNYLTGNQNISVSGDASGTGTTAITLTLATVNTNVGTWNNVTVNGKGLVTAGSNVSYLTANQSITLSGDIAGTGTTAIATTLPDINSNVGTFQGITVNAKGQVTSAVNQNYVTTSGVTSITQGAGITVTNGATANPTVALSTPVDVANGGTGASSFTANALVASNTTATGALRVHSDLTVAQRGTIVDSLLNVSTLGLIRRSAANTYSIDAATYLTANQSITLSGDVAGSGATAITTTLANVNANVGTFQGITVNAKGLVTAATNQNYITGNQTITLSGDISGTGATAITATLPNINSNVGTFQGITVNAKGQVTGAVNQNYVTTSGVTSITQGTGISVTNGSTANPTVAISIPVAVASGGTGAITAPLALDSLSGATGTTAGALQRTSGGGWSVVAIPPSGVTSVSQGTGITVTDGATANPTVALSVPVAVTSGGTGAITAPLALDSLSGASGAATGALLRSSAGTWSVSELAGPEGPEGPAGEQGDPGPIGPSGIDGISSFSPLREAFTVPAIGGMVVIELENAAWCQVGAVIFVAGMTGVITAVDDNDITVTRIASSEGGGGIVPGPTVPMATGTAPHMLAATNGAVILTGDPPVLTRIGDTVFLTYQGANKSSTTANTISIAEIPPGFRPTANVAQAIQTPAITMNVQIYTSGTNVFADAPGTNATGGNTRWSLRHGTQFAANAAVSISMQWRTADAMP